MGWRSSFRGALGLAAIGSAALWITTALPGSTLEAQPRTDAGVSDPRRLGSVQTTAVDDPGTRIAPGSQLRGVAEVQAPAVTGEATAPPIAQPSSPTPRSLALAARGRLGELKACRAEVASERRVGTGSVTAGSLLVRFTVEPDGGVTRTEVVAVAATDPAVMSCVDGRVSRWRFTEPAERPARPVRLTERLTFD